jgi:hypothetical protein
MKDGKSALADYQPGSAVLRMKRDEWVHLAQLATAPMSSAKQALGSLVHEAAHAYADHINLVGSFGFTLADGRSDSQLTAAQRHQVFQDAIADYAEDRVGAYWTAYNSLVHARAGGTLSREYGTIRDEYNAQMSIKGGFGYLKEGGEPVSDESVLPEWARNRVDQDFLGGTIKDKFEDVAAFKQFAPPEDKK